MKRNLALIIISVLVIAIVATVFGRWFTYPQIIGGDWPYFFPENLRESSLYSSIWLPWLGNGTGGINPVVGLHEFQVFLIVVFNQWFHLPWDLVYKVGWYGLVIILSFWSSQVLVKKVIKNTDPALNHLASLIWLTNTYIVMLLGGGQMGVALAYSLSPLVLASFIRLIEAIGEWINFKYPVTAALVLGIQILFDPRIAYITMAGVGLYYLIILTRRLIAKEINLTKVLGSFFWVFGIPVLLSGLYNAFWLLPLVALHDNPFTQMGSAYYTNISAVKFFSFADFSHALTLLQPNWPENIFGKTYFLQPEFLIIPFLAFAALLWSSKKEPKILFFALLGLLGAFLAKGANEPMGSVYVFLFSRLPGFEMFRDPTKWYILTALSYTVLIPLTISKISLTLKFKDSLLFVSIGFIAVWAFLIRPAVTAGLGGTFKLHMVPTEYLEARELVSRQADFFRTLWVPNQDRFSLVTSMHPALEARVIFEATNAGQLKEKMLSPQVEEELATWSVKYVIVPYDALAEFFLTDRKYDDRLRQSYLKVLDNLPWLGKIKDGKITIYETKKHQGLFWADSGKVTKVVEKQFDEFQISLETYKPTTLHFSQAYHPGWIAEATGSQIRSREGAYGVNSFYIDKPGNYNLRVYFEPQKYVWLGVAVSFISLLISLAVLRIRRR